MELLTLVGALVLLLAIGMPVAFAIAAACLVHIAIFERLALWEIVAVPVMYGAVDSFLLAAVPLFLLMGMLMQRGGISEVLFSCASVWLRHIPGGLGIATTVSCGLFAALSGSSPATAATIGSASIPAMISRGYPESFTYGLIAAGGTLGILIPPSISLVVFGAITGESVGRLFIAGVVPGVLLAALFAAYAYLRARGGGVATEPRADWAERGRLTFRATGALALPPVILGGIYLGIVTPTEAAALGVALALLLGLVVYRTLPLADLGPVVLRAARISCMILMIIAAASVFSHLVTLMRVPQNVAAFVSEAGVPHWMFWLVIMGLIILLGCFLEAAAIIYLVVPVVAPVLPVLGIDPTHFAIVMVVLIELGMITPPLGLNLFVIMGIRRGASFADVVRGSLPFMILLLAAAIVVIVAPGLSLWLPNLLGA
jgi:C4-dicarboxylate transporter DctM subunit